MNGSFSVGWVVMKKLEKTIINGQIINFNRTYNYLEDLFTIQEAAGYFLLLFGLQCLFV